MTNLKLNLKYVNNHVISSRTHETINSQIIRMERPCNIRQFLLCHWSTFLYPRWIKVNDVKRNRSIAEKLLGRVESRCTRLISPRVNCCDLCQECQGFFLTAPVNFVVDSIYNYQCVWKIMFIERRDKTGILISLLHSEFFKNSVQIGFYQFVYL